MLEKLSFLLFNSIVTLSLLTFETLPRVEWESLRGQPAQKAAVVKTIFHLLDRSRSLAYEDEELCPLTHSLQCASLARANGADEEVILAALLHNIGRCWFKPFAEEMEGRLLHDEDEEGARFLKNLGFSKKITDLVRGHIQTMRYRAFVDPEGFAAMPPAIQELVAHRGGPHSQKDAQAFEGHPYYWDLIQLHQWDSQSHDPHNPALPLESFREMLLRHLN